MQQDEAACLLNRRIIERCDCGWLVTSWTPPALAEHIARIFAQPEEMKRRGENGRRWFETRYNWEIESAQAVAMVERVITPTEVVTS